MKKADLEWLSNALDLAGYEIREIRPLQDKRVEAGLLYSTDRGEGFELQITPKRDD